MRVNFIQIKFHAYLTLAQQAAKLATPTPALYSSKNIDISQKPSLKYFCIIFSCQIWLFCPIKSTYGWISQCDTYKSNIERVNFSENPISTKIQFRQKPFLVRTLAIAYLYNVQKSPSAKCSRFSHAL